MEFIVQIVPRARGGYVASIKEAEKLGFADPVLGPKGQTIAAGIGDDPQQALLKAAYQWAGEK